MLSRYHMKRGARKESLPKGIRQDTRKHTQHILRPESGQVVAYMADPSPEAWEGFKARYLHVLGERLAGDSSAFEQLAELAGTEDVWLGCSCPTRLNPDLRRCHTWLALEFMKARFPELEVVFPG